MVGHMLKPSRSRSSVSPPARWTSVGNQSEMWISSELSVPFVDSSRSLQTHPTPRTPPAGRMEIVCLGFPSDGKPKLTAQQSLLAEQRQGCVAQLCSALQAKSQRGSGHGESGSCWGRLQSMEKFCSAECQCMRPMDSRPHAIGPSRGTHRQKGFSSPLSAGGYSLPQRRARRCLQGACRKESCPCQN